MKIFKFKRKDGALEVVAVSSYAKKPVRAVAKCHPDDTFNETIGEKLAIARCNQKVADKRCKNAKRKVLEAMRVAAEAHTHYQKMVKYYADSFEALTNANNEIDAIMIEIENNI